MTRAQAIKRLERLYGKGKGYFRVLNMVTSPELRQAALEELRALCAQKSENERQTQEWLDAQPFYQQQTEKRKALIKQIRAAETRGLSRAFKFTIGRNIGWANEITGEGDTWEAAFAKADVRTAARAAFKPAEESREAVR